MGITKEQLENLYVAQKLSVKNCAEVMGCSYGGAYARLQKFGIQTRSKGRTDHRIPGITKECLDELYIKRGLSVRECATELGLPTHGAVTGRLHEFGILVRPQLQSNKFHGGGHPPEKHNSWKGGKRLVICAQCGKQLTRFPSHIQKNNFCNFTCKGEWESENLKGNKNPNYGNSVLTGQNNPNWKGGITCEPYTPIWVDKRFKAGIKERDNHTCQNPDCRGNDNTLAIHHIDYDKKNCDEKNLITLCRACNGRANFNREFWEAGYTEIVSQKYETTKQQLAI